MAGDQLTTSVEEERVRQEYVSGLKAREAKTAAEVGHVKYIYMSIM